MSLDYNSIAQTVRSTDDINLNKKFTREQSGHLASVLFNLFLDGLQCDQSGVVQEWPK